MGDSIIEFIRLLEQAKSSVYILIGFAILLISYSVLFAMPVLAYIRANNYIKAEAEAQHKGSVSGALATTKSVMVTLAVTAVIYTLFFYIFIDIIGLGKTASEVLEKMMFINLFK